LDHIERRIAEVRGLLAASPHLIAAFLSPTGTGLKALFAIAADASRHKESFEAVRQHVLALTGVEIDEACKDVTRLCFVSYDPSLEVHETALIVPLPHGGGAAGEVPTAYSAPSASSASSASSAPSAWHPPSSVMETIKRVAASEAADAKLKTDQPELHRLYWRFVGWYVEAVESERNAFLVKAVPYLHGCVCGPLVLKLAEVFYDLHLHMWKDSKAQHLKEAKAMLAGVSHTYAESLSAEEREVYQALPEDKQGAFRICRALALMPKKKGEEPGTFFLSCGDLGARLMLDDKMAHRILRYFQKVGLLALVQLGQKRMPGVKPIASSYRWLLKGGSR
jgi:hypothetical protein